MKLLGTLRTLILLSLLPAGLIRPAAAINIAPAGAGIIGVNDNVDFTDLGLPLPHAGTVAAINDGDLLSRVDNFGNGANGFSYVGVTWATPRIDVITSLTLTMATFFDGGWFGPNSVGPGAGGALTAPTYLSEPEIQVTTDGGVTWATVAHTSDYLTAFEGHTIGGGANPNPTSREATFTLETPATAVNGIRIIGANGGPADGNGFIGVFELAIEAHPANDTDSDGMDDDWEMDHNLVVGVNDAGDDPDMDGLTNVEEFNLDIDPQNEDTDGDQLLDGDEAGFIGTNPALFDTDGDGLGDGDELNVYFTDPTTADSDGDGLSDGDEILVYLTDPISTDTDLDGFSDGAEVAQGSDPLSDSSYPPNIALGGMAIIGTNDGFDTSFLGNPASNAGVPANINDGNPITRVDTYGPLDSLGYVGITWFSPRPQPVTRLELTMATFLDGGWFGPNFVGPGAGGSLDPIFYLEEPTVQISVDGGGTWTDVPHTSNYLTAFAGHLIGGGGVPNPSAQTAVFVLDTPAENITGIRLIGMQGGTASGGFIGVFELAVRDTTSEDDRDGDGLSDDEENTYYLTDPDVADTDGDGLNDGLEVRVRRTNPLLFDTDGDEFGDGLEIAVGTNPLRSSSFPANAALAGTGILGTNDLIDSDAGTPFSNGGSTAYINDGDSATRVDTFSQLDPNSFVGILWNTPRVVPVKQIKLTLATFFDGGWFGPNNSGGGSGTSLAAADLIEPEVQVTTDGGVTWTTVSHTSDYLSVFDGHPLPAVDFGLPTSDTATFTLDTPQTGINGIRVIGSEGGTASGGFLGVFEMAIPSSLESATDTDGDGLPDAWEVTHFTTIVGHGPDDDDEHDGLTALEEYAYQTDPKIADAGAAPRPTIVNGYLTISLTKQPGVRFTVETTGSVRNPNWSSATTTVLPSDLTTLIVRDNFLITDGAPRFMRVRVSAP